MNFFTSDNFLEEKKLKDGLEYPVPTLCISTNQAYLCRC